MIRSVEEYEARTDESSLAGFLEETALGGRDDFSAEPNLGNNAVTLMTLHSAKGLEFPHVYMVGMEEGLIPHRRVIAEGNGVDEERRLCYVGVTRAEDTLSLSMCKARTKWGKARPSIPSRFVLEMRGELEKAARAAEAGEALIKRDLEVASAAEAAARKKQASPKQTGDSRTAAAKTAQRPSVPSSDPSRPGAKRPERRGPSGGLGIATRPTLPKRPGLTPTRS